MDESVTLYLRNVPAGLVREAKVKAAREGTTLTAVVIDALARALEPGGEAPEPLSEELRAAMGWYKENRARLLRRYGGEYVAIRDGTVLDHDEDFESLASRVFARFGSGPIFMPRMVAGTEEVRVRSPRRRVS